MDEIGVSVMEPIRGGTILAGSHPHLPAKGQGEDRISIALSNLTCQAYRHFQRYKEEKVVVYRVPARLGQDSDLEVR